MMDQNEPSDKKQPGLKRAGSDSRFDNTEYLEKQEAKMIDGLIGAMGLSAEEV